METYRENHNVDIDVNYRRYHAPVRICQLIINLISTLHSLTNGETND